MKSSTLFNIHGNLLATRNKAKKTRKRNMQQQDPEVLDIIFKQLAAQFTVPVQTAARNLGITVRELRKRCARVGLIRWPYKQSYLKHVATDMGNMRFDFKVNENSKPRGMATRCKSASSPIQQVVSEATSPVASPKHMQNEIQQQSIPSLQDSLSLSVSPFSYPAFNEHQHESNNHQFLPQGNNSIQFSLPSFKELVQSLQS